MPNLSLHIRSDPDTSVVAYPRAAWPLEVGRNRAYRQLGWGCLLLWGRSERCSADSGRQTQLLPGNKSFFQLRRHFDDGLYTIGTFTTIIIGYGRMSGLTWSRRWTRHSVWLAGLRCLTPLLSSGSAHVPFVISCIWSIGCPVTTFGLDIRKPQTLLIISSKKSNTPRFYGAKTDMQLHVESNTDTHWFLSRVWLVTLLSSPRQHCEAFISVLRKVFCSPSKHACVRMYVHARI